MKQKPTVRMFDNSEVVKVSEVPGFSQWLNGQTMPVVADDPEPFNWAFIWDYERYINGLPVID